jgi:hypothetical protein
MNRQQIASTLVRAVQHADLAALNSAVEAGNRYAYVEYQATPAFERGRIENLINDKVGPLGLTALHVAVAMYAQGVGDKETLNLITGVLLDRGACPYVPYGQKFKTASHGPVMVDPGTTLFMQFRGEQLPPALRRWMAEQREDELTFHTAMHQRVKYKSAA